MRIERFYTKAGQSAYAGLSFELTRSEIRNPDGSVVFSLDGVEVPAGWSQVAADVLAQKYFRKAGVPSQRLKRVEETQEFRVLPMAFGSPTRRHLPQSFPKTERFMFRNQAQSQVYNRLAGCWTYWGWKSGYLRTSEEDHARSFYGRTSASCSPTQMVAPNSPQWFNTGLHWAYGIDGPSQGHYLRRLQDEASSLESNSSYERPQPHACFIQGVSGRSGQ